MNDTLIIDGTTLQKLTIHEEVSKSFEKTPNGNIFTKDVKMIFSLTIICLELTEKPLKSSAVKSILNRHYPFSFTIEEAVKKMTHLTSTVESLATKTTISHSIKRDLALSLIKTFMTARLLHTPADRTRSEPKEKVLLQPTPKGVAVLQKYCKIIGLKTQLPILNSSFNSMDLFIFERSPITDSIIYSEYLVHILFTRFIGPSPNVWNPNNSPDEIPTLDKRLEADDEFDFSNFQNIPSFDDYQQEKSRSASETSETSPRGLISQLVGKKPKVSAESPFAHAFFTNPESDAHVQYYVSNKGVRLYENHKFGSMKIKYSFNAKAAWQWIMDCTDITQPQEATTVLNLFYKYGLIAPIIVPPSTATSKRNFPPLKTSVYTFTKKGSDISAWGDNTRGIIASEEETLATAVEELNLSNQMKSSDRGSLSDGDSDSIHETLTITKVLSDPGMRYLFRTHLEKEFCAENLDVYIEIKLFSKKMTILRNLLNAYGAQKEILVDGRTKIKPPSRRTLVKLINECLSSVYNIYSSYVFIGAPHQLNIEHSLREKITDAMVHSSSPLKTHFSDEVHKSLGTDFDYQTTQPPKIEVPEPAHIKSEPPSTLPPVNIPTNVPQFSKNNQLFINIVEINDGSKHDIPKSPIQDDIVKSLTLLHKLYPLLDIVGQRILKMLEFDSFPKFLNSETLALANLN